MKVFISVDIEGIAFAVSGAGTRPEGHAYNQYSRQMSREASAAAEGAFAAGAAEVVVRDAHGIAADNILPELLPAGVQLARGWSGDPRMMMDGIDKSFDAALYVGYHSAAGQEGNALGHTINGAKVHCVRINGEIASEFLINHYTAAYYGVPSVFLSGDSALCQCAAAAAPGLVTVAVKSDIGGCALCKHPDAAVAAIRKGAEEALRQELAPLRRALPKTFEVALTFTKHTLACAKSHYPGARRADAYTVVYETSDWYEALRFLVLVLS